MKIAILGDYERVVPTLDCFALLHEHDVTVFADEIRDWSELVYFDALVLIRERTQLTGELLARLQRLQLISQTGRIGRNIDLEACAARGITVMEGVGSQARVDQRKRVTVTMRVDTDHNVDRLCKSLPPPLQRGTIPVPA